ncbi:actinorhodin polyketide synthase [Actinomadura sp. LD22]|uniref:Actinorhodin polyketide synthase n=1 Tax=Actinomadura physcomitrii TaxID=2650748 RepID=A0A6I4MBN1_9ACTN|nr:acyl carrier protein [Actinomadura physcomitrii]MWA03658.1 actinorhodin polyketide synthase [Actinomadura physcomitrii]
MPTTTFTMDDLTRLLRECAGEDDSIDLDGDIAGTEFEDLGYDSLALFNTVNRIERDYGIRLSDEIVAEVRTPGELLAEIAEHL